MAEDGSTIDERAVQTLAGAGALALSADRLPLLAPQLDTLLRGANALSQLMAERRELGLVVQFTHPEVWQE